jgi:hypothetical protein
LAGYSGQRRNASTKPAAHTSALALEKVAEAAQAAEDAMALSPLDPQMYLFTHAESIGHCVAGRWEEALELGEQSLRANRLQTPALRIVDDGADQGARPDADRCDLPPQIPRT